MKRTNILLVILLWVVNQVNAQLVQENETAVVYYMPKTELAITLSYDCVVQEPGIFYQYAQRYLGTRDIITEKSTTYHMTDMTFSTLTTADTNRAYKVNAQKIYDMQLLSFTEDGRLLGYNIGGEAEKKIEVSTPHKIKQVDEQKTPLMPLLEEQFMAGSTAKMAEGAAKQIYRIRETRLNILGGDVEHVPADGKAMQLVLDELDKQEQALVALFIGTTYVSHHTHELTYLPANDSNKEILCRLSKHMGIVDKDDLSGEPIYLSLAGHHSTLKNALIEADTKAPVPSQIYYNLPGTADVVLQYQNLQFTHSITVPQYGVAIPLAIELFNSKHKHTIRFNPETGNILYIQK
jgi:hypothetical protein